MWIRDELLKHPEEHYYIPYFRTQCLYGEYADGEEHGPSETWIQIEYIDELEDGSDLSKFRKNDGTQIKNTHCGIIYREDPEIV